MTAVDTNVVVRLLISDDPKQTENEVSIAAAIALTQHGIDFADALHLTSRTSGANFVSFDQEFVRRGKRAGIAATSRVV